MQDMSRGPRNLRLIKEIDNILSSAKDYDGIFWRWSLLVECKWFWDASIDRHEREYRASVSNRMILMDCSLISLCANEFVSAGLALLIPEHCPVFLLCVIK